MKAGRILLAWAAAIATLAVVVATSDPDPEGLAVGPQHLEQVLADEAKKAECPCCTARTAASR